MSNLEKRIDEKELILNMKKGKQRCWFLGLPSVWSEKIKKYLFNTKGPKGTLLPHTDNIIISDHQATVRMLYLLLKLFQTSMIYNGIFVFLSANWENAPKGTGATRAAGAAKCPFQIIDFGEILIYINIQMEASCFKAAVTIIEQFLLLSGSQNVGMRCLASYAIRRFPICFNCKLWHLNVPVLQFLPRPHHEASGASEYRLQEEIISFYCRGILGVSSTSSKNSSLHIFNSLLHKLVITAP